MLRSKEAHKDPRAMRKDAAMRRTQRAMLSGASACAICGAARVARGKERINKRTLQENARQALSGEGHAVMPHMRRENAHMFVYNQQMNASASQYTATSVRAIATMLSVNPVIQREDVLIAAR